MKTVPIAQVLEGGPDETVEPTTQDLVTIAEIEIAQEARKPRRKLSRIEQLRAIVESCSIAKVEGVFVDLTSANVAVACYNAARPEIRAKLDAMPIKRMIAVCFSALRS